MTRTSRPEPLSRYATRVFFDTAAESLDLLPSGDALLTYRSSDAAQSAYFHALHCGHELICVGRRLRIVEGGN